MVNIPPSVQREKIPTKMFSVYIEILCRGENKKQVQDAVTEQLADVFGVNNYNVWEVEELADPDEIYGFNEDEPDTRDGVLRDGVLCDGEPSSRDIRTAHLLERGENEGV